MNSVIVEYKEANVIRIVEQASERRSREYAEACSSRDITDVAIEANQIKSPNIERDNSFKPCASPASTGWKHNKHASKNWERHICRLSS